MGQVRQRRDDDAASGGAGAAAPLSPLPASKLLLGGRTLLLLPSLVGLVGLNEAVVLQQVRYRLGDDLRPRLREGRRWVRDPLERWRERDFPFWEIDTVRRAFQSLEAQGVLLAAQFDRHLRDQTKWYTIDFAALGERERAYRVARAGTPPPRPGATAVPAPTAASALPPLPDSHLLIDEPPLVIVVDLAVALGLDEALLLQQIRYWLADERKPPVREGRRWVCPRAVDLFAPLAFRSAKTIARALRALEERGLLLASARFNPAPGDRTKWYTIDFARVAALRPAAPPTPLPRGQNASIERDNSPDSVRPFPAVPATQNADRETTTLPASKRPECQGQAPILPVSLMETETEHETEHETEQQQRATPGPVVVAATVGGSDPVTSALVDRGLTSAVATRLRLAIPAAIVARQLAIFDWLCVADPDDPRLTPGRLRRQIEENWSAPPGFLPADEREAREAEQRAACGRAARAREAVAVQAAAAVSDRQDRLDALGLTSADQVLWARIAQQAPPLPPPFRDALFHAPRGEAPAAVIFRERAAWARATGAAHAATRAAVAARVAALCHRPDAAVHYLPYDDVLRLLAMGEAAPV